MTVARPASAPTWATDANFTNGGTGIAGTPTKVAPSSPVQAEGNVPGTPLPAQRLNWFQNLSAGWNAWLSAIIGADEEHTYQAAKGRAYRSHPKIVYPGSWTPNLPSSAGLGYQTAVHSDEAWLDISDDLRSGQVFTGVSLRCKMGHTEATPANRLSIAVWKVSGSGFSGGITQLGATFNVASSTAEQSASVTGLTETVDRLTYRYYIQVISSTTAGDGGSKDYFFYTSPAYNDVGPRNPQ